MRRKTDYTGNEQHLQVLKESVRRGSNRFWNQWRKNHPRVVPDLRGVILAGAWLRAFNFDRARLDGAVLDRADLASVRLEQASLRAADLYYANLSSVHGRKANLSGARLGNATLRLGDFRSATFLDDAYLNHANCQEANFSRAKLAGANLTDADLTSTRFDGADLAGAQLDGAILNRSSFLGASLRSASVGGAFIRHVQTDRKTDQRDLAVDVHVVWERARGRMIEFDQAQDLRLAQFHDVVDEHGAVANLISASAKRVVLILGSISAEAQARSGSTGGRVARARKGTGGVRFPWPGGTGGKRHRPLHCGHVAVHRGRPHESEFRAPGAAGDDSRFDGAGPADRPIR